MPSVMMRYNDAGKLLFYIAKKDQEDVVDTVEIDTEDSWGGKVTTSAGDEWFIDPISPPPSFPTTLRFKKA